MTHRPAGTTFANMSMPDARSAPLLSVCLGGLGGLVVHGDKLDRLPVLKAMVEAQEDMRGSACSAAETVIQVGVGVPENMSAAAVAEFLRRDPDDYVLDSVPEVAALQRRTLDWLGVDVSVLRTARELREEKQLLKGGAAKLMIVSNVRDCVRGMAGGHNRAWVERVPELQGNIPALREEVRQAVMMMFNERDPEHPDPDSYFPEGYRMSREGEVLLQATVEGFPWGISPEEAAQSAQRAARAIELAMLR